MIEIYFDDLKEEVQKQILEEAGLKSPEEANWDIFPLCEFEINPED